MNNNHTPEPWCLGASGLHVMEYNGGKGPYRQVAELWFGDQITGAGNSGIARDEAEANARRIAACVNACAGIDTLQLEMLDIKSALDQAGETRKRRDALLAALEKSANYLAAYCGEEGHCQPVIDEARATIAASRGGA